MPSGRVRPAVLTILAAALLLLANGVPASAADPTPPPCKTAAEFDPANFPNPPKIDNQWNPLAPGMQFVMAGEAKEGKGLLPHRVVSTVTDLIKVVNDVPAVVILETHINQGVLVKSELAFQAQDNAGNLWNLGEFPAEFDDKGNFERAPDTWISGLSNAEPGNLMLGNPQLGTPEYLQGWSPDIEFLNCAKVYKMQQKTCVPAGCYDNVLITEERSPLAQESGRMRKYYAPGVGNVRVDAVGDPKDETLVLAEVSQLSPDDLEKVRQEALKLEKTANEVNALYRQTSPTVLTTEPPAEPTGPESPQPTQNKPSIESPTSRQQTENRYVEPSAENQVILGRWPVSGPGGPPPTLDFGAVPEGHRKRMSIRLVNRSIDEDYRIESVSVTTTEPREGSDFWLASNGCVEILKPGDSCVVEVIFEPGGHGTKSGSVTIVTIEGTTDIVLRRHLTGTGAGSADPSQSSEPSDTESTDEKGESADPSESAEPRETTEPSGPSPEATAE
jgi:hypothetical protein